jgi:hypothetical protein
VGVTGAGVLSLAVASGNCLTVGYIMTALPLEMKTHPVAPLIVAVMFGHDHLVRILLDLTGPNDALLPTGIIFLIIPQYDCLNAIFIKLENLNT